MRLLTRSKGAHRAVLSGKARIAAVVTVGLLALGGGATAFGAADASPWNPNVDLVGVVGVCHGGETPRTVNVSGNTGDRGSVPVAPGRFYAVHLHHVPGGPGERISGTVDCAGPRPTHYIRRVPFRVVTVQRPWRGNTVRHNI